MGSRTRRVCCTSPWSEGGPLRGRESGSIPHRPGTWCAWASAHGMGGLWVFMLGDFNQLAAPSWELVSPLVRTRQ